MRTLPLLALLLAAPALAQGAPPLVDPPDLAVDRLTDEELVLTIRLVAPQQIEAGTETRSLAVDRAAGTVTLMTETAIPLAGQRMRATYVAAYPSLAAISILQIDGTDVTELDFADGRVTGTHAGDPVDAALDGPVFLNGFQPVLARLLPFAEGYTAVVPGYSTGDGVVAVTLTVVGREADGGREVWVVEADRADDAPTVTFRVDAETHGLVSYGLAPQPGVRFEFQRD